MAARSIGSGTISFGLVAIPIKLYTAAQAQGIHFNMLCPKSRLRAKQQYVDPETNEVVERDAMLKGYEHARGQYVIFTSDEIKAMESPSTGGIFDIVEFVPLDSVDLLNVEKSYFVGPNKGGDKGYILLSQALQRQNKCAVARWINRGKEHLVILRPYHNGLVAHQMYYADEVRDFDAAIDLAHIPITDAEMGIACQLIESLTSKTLEVAKYEDTYRRTILRAIEAKINNDDVVAISEQGASATTVDLMSALEASLKQYASTKDLIKGARKASESAKAAVNGATLATKELEKPYKGRGFNKETLMRLAKDLHTQDPKALQKRYRKSKKNLELILEWERRSGKLRGMEA